MDMKPRDGPKHGYMKCFTCEEFCVSLPWGLEEGYKMNVRNIPHNIVSPTKHY